MGDPREHQERRALLPQISADVSVSMPEPYTPSATLSDDYRCFVLDPGFSKDVFVTGHDVTPGQPGVVHHVILYAIGGDGIEGFSLAGAVQFRRSAEGARGDKVHLECVYDNSAGADTVGWGEGPKDEMCLAFFYLTQ